MEPQALELRDFTQSQVGAVLTAFDALKPGEALLVLSPEIPGGLLVELQKIRANLFNWSVIDSTAGKCRVEISRREDGASRGVNEYLTWDHRRLEGIFEEVRELAHSGDFFDAAQRFVVFRSGLERHIVIEESVLFPHFEKHSGMSQGGPTEVMRNEHVLIKKALAEIAEALKLEDTQLFNDAGDLLFETLEPHDQKEERVLYPLCDETLGGDAGRAEMVAKMQRV
jgi:hemerythrin-like domain-containing protein